MSVCVVVDQIEYTADNHQIITNKAQILSATNSRQSRERWYKQLKGKNVQWCNLGIELEKECMIPKYPRFGTQKQWPISRFQLTMICNWHCCWYFHMYTYDVVSDWLYPLLSIVILSPDKLGYPLVIRWFGIPINYRYDITSIHW